MRKIFWMLVAIIGCPGISATAQELFPFSEPASNMPSKAIGVRITTEGMIEKGLNRTVPEVMVGFNKNLMAHVQGFFSNMDGSFRAEGASTYVKYRFLSQDDAQKHFRMAAFGRVSYSNRKARLADINLEGDNSGWQAGLIATQLLHKLAISGTAGFARSVGKSYSGSQFTWTISSGYLLLPFIYKDYNQPNFNLYTELLGRTDLETGKNFADLAPAVQVIINSRTRIDAGYRFRIAGPQHHRYNMNMYVIRAEFNFFNALK